MKIMRFAVCCVLFPWLVVMGTLVVGTGGCLEDERANGGTTARRAVEPVSRGATDSNAALPTGLGMRGAGGQSGAAGVISKSPPTTQAPWKGGARAKVVIEEFTDFECPFCRGGWQTMNQVLKHYGPRVKLVFRHLPLSFHKQAMIAAEAAVCAQRQGKFWAMQDQIFQNNRALSRADLIGYARRIGLDVPRFTRDLDNHACKQRVLDDIAHSKAKGVSATPAFFINGSLVEGAYPFSHFKKLIDVELAN